MNNRNTTMETQTDKINVVSAGSIAHLYLTDKLECGRQAYLLPLRPENARELIEAIQVAIGDKEPPPVTRVIRTPVDRFSITVEPHFAPGPKISLRVVETLTNEDPDPDAERYYAPLHPTQARELGEALLAAASEADAQ